MRFRSRRSTNRQCRSRTRCNSQKPRCRSRSARHRGTYPSRRRSCLCSNRREWRRTVRRGVRKRTPPLGRGRCSSPRARCKGSTSRGNTRRSGNPRRAPWEGRTRCCSGRALRGGPRRCLRCNRRPNNKTGRRRSWYCPFRSRRPPRTRASARSRPSRCRGHRRGRGIPRDSSSGCNTPGRGSMPRRAHRRRRTSGRLPSMPSSRSRCPLPACNRHRRRRSTGRPRTCRRNSRSRRCTPSRWGGTGRGGTPRSCTTSPSRSSPTRSSTSGRRPRTGTRRRSTEASGSILRPPCTVRPCPGSCSDRLRNGSRRSNPAPRCSRRLARRTDGTTRRRSRCPCSRVGPRDRRGRTPERTRDDTRLRRTRRRRSSPRRHCRPRSPSRSRAGRCPHGSRDRRSSRPSSRTRLRGPHMRERRRSRRCPRIRHRSTRADRCSARRPACSPPGRLPRCRRSPCSSRNRPHTESHL